MDIPVMGESELMWKWTLDVPQTGKSPRYDPKKPKIKITEMRSTAIIFEPLKAAMSLQSRARVAGEKWGCAIRMSHFLLLPDIQLC